MLKQHVQFACAACGFTFEADVGPETRRDATGRARRATGFQRAFWCPREEKVLTLDVQDEDFSGRCPDCEAQLELLADFPLDACPRCHTPARA